MPSDIPWYAGPITIGVYIIFESIHRGIFGRFFTTTMLSELIDAIVETAEEFKSDIDGARLCARIISAAWMLCVIIILGVSIWSLINYESLKDIANIILLILGWLVFTLVLRFINNFFISWAKSRA